MPNSSTQIDTISPTTIAAATTRELIAIHDIADTLANVLTGLTLAPRCRGPVADWTKGLLESLYEARGSAAAALLTRTDEDVMRAVTLVKSLEWGLEDEDSAALLRVVQDVASRPGARPI